MPTIQLHTGDPPLDPTLTFTLVTRAHSTAPWNTSNFHMGIKTLGEAIRAAKRKLEFEPWLFIQVWDQHGQKHWSNEDASP
jgi:hypothetical protein